MNVFELSVPGDPLSKARPRVYNGHGVTDRRTRNAENRVYSEFRRKYGDVEPIKGDVRIRLEFWMASWHPRDFDNLAKLVTDSLNGVAMRMTCRSSTRAYSSTVPTGGARLQTGQHAQPQDRRPAAVHGRTL